MPELELDVLNSRVHLRASGPAQELFPLLLAQRQFGLRASGSWHAPFYNLTREQESAALTTEIEELIASADATDEEHRRQIEQVEQSLAKATDQAAASADAAETMREEARSAREESSELRAKLAAAQATVETLQKSMDAVLARIPAPAKPAKKSTTK